MESWIFASEASRNTLGVEVATQSDWYAEGMTILDAEDDDEDDDEDGREKEKGIGEEEKEPSHS